MSEFHPRFASLPQGLIAVVLAILGYVIFPYLFLTGLVALTNEVDLNDEGAWKAIVEDWRSIVLYLSILLTALAFFRGFYWKGSYARLTFALIMTAIFAYLLWSLLLDGRVQSAVDAEDLELQANTFIYFFLGFVLLYGLFNLGEYVDWRKEFVRRRNIKDKLPEAVPAPHEDPTKHLWHHDFRLRYGSWSIGFKTARRYYGRFMVWPILLFIVTTAVLLKVNDLAPFELQNELENAVTLLFWTGLFIVAMSFFKGFYPKGSLSRMSFWLVMVGVVCLWIWFFLFGGKLALEIADIVEFSVDMAPIVLILMFAASLWGVYAIVEWWSYRREWVDDGFRPEHMPKKKGLEQKPEK